MSDNRIPHQYSVIVPIYNEAEGLADFVSDLRTKLKDEPYELILVDDGSTDQTKTILDRLDNSQSICFTHDSNRGYGAALKTGIKNAHTEIIVIIDSDGTYPIEDIPKLVGLLEKDDAMVVGARVGADVNIPLVRRPAKFILSMVANYLTRTKIPDLNSGLRVMRKDIVQKFFNILPNNFSFTTTITLAVLTNHMKINYVPINYHKRQGRSKIRPINDTLNFIQLIIRTVLYFEPLRIFIPFSLSLFILGVSIFFIGVFYFSVYLDTTSAIIISTSVIVMTVGMLADLIDKKLG